MATTPGYSGTPLAKKLGIAAGCRVVTWHAPADYRELLSPLPGEVTFGQKINTSTDLLHIFAEQSRVLATELAKARRELPPDAAVWVSWPKKASKRPTDITEDTIRALALPLGFVDVKVCAVTEVWSGLKLVVRKELRGVN
jgi:hypothetical protein